MLPRLQQIVDLSRLEEVPKVSLKISVLFSLMAVAVQTKDKDLEEACALQIKRLQEERDRARAAPEVKEQPPPHT